MRAEGSLLVFLFALLFLKSAGLALDPVVKFFFGDSWCYLETAANGWIPPDRSFTYGFFIRAITWPSGSLWPLILSQALASLLSAALAAHILRRHLCVRPSIAYLLGVLCALEPIQLLYERYVMTETLSLSLFALHILAILRYLRDRNLLILGLAQLLGAGLISLRISFLPITWANALLAPLLTFLSGEKGYEPSGLRPPLKDLVASRSGRLLPCSVHLVVSLGFTLCFHGGYKWLFSAVSGNPPGYNAAAGYFLLATWAPVVEPEDFPDPQFGAKLFEGLPFDPKDRAMRNHQLFEYGGLVDRLRTAMPGPEGNQTARIAALNALKRDPWGVASLWLQTLGDYFRLGVLREKIIDDLAVEQVPQYQGLLEVHGDRFSLPRWEAQPWTLVRKYYLYAMPWYWFLLLSPALGLCGLACAQIGAARQAFLLLVSLLACITVATALAVYPIVRYLHPVGWLTLCLMGPVMERVAERIFPGRSRSRLPFS